MDTGRRFNLCGLYVHAGQTGNAPVSGAEILGKQRELNLKYE